MKAATNYAVTLERLAKRQEAVLMLGELKERFGGEMRVTNNLAIIQKRNGDAEEAQANFRNALEAEPDSFHPNYNLGLLLSQNRTDPESLRQSLEHFTMALKSKPNNC